MIMWGNWTNIGVDSIFKLEKKDGKQMKNKKQKKYVSGAVFLKMKKQKQLISCVNVR